MSFIIQEHKQGCSDNEYISKETEHIRDLSEEQESKDCGEDDLAVVVDGDLSCRSALVCCGNGELATGGAQSCTDQDQNLLWSRHDKMSSDPWNDDQGREGGKVKYNDRTLHSIHTHFTNHGIGNAGAQASKDTHQGRKQFHILKSRLYNAQTSEECQNQTEELNRFDLFFQNKIRKDNGKKRRQLI